jgi:hypothetical protein
VTIKFDATQLQELSVAMRRIAPQTYKASQKAVRAAALEVLADAEDKASFSSRIPGSGKVIMRGLNARIRFGGDSAPDAAPIENRGKGNPKHPLWGNRNYWYVTEHGPFLAPAFLAKQAMLDEVLASAVEDATTIVLRTP